VASSSAVMKSGVEVAAGSDMCWFYPGKTRGQASATIFANLHAAGMPPLDILRAVTVNAAELLAGQDALALVEPGKFGYPSPSPEIRSRHYRAGTGAIRDGRRPDGQE